MKRADLLRALEIVKPGLDSKERIEQSTSFAFIDNCVVTYNDEVSVRHAVEGLNLTGAIKADELYKLLGKLTQDDIEITAKESEVIFTSGRAKAGFTLETELKLPLDEIGERTDWKPLPADFTKALEFVMTTCARDMTRPELTCIHVRSDGLLESSDNFRISTYKIDKIPAKSFLLPATSAQILAKYALAHIAEGNGWVHFRTQEGGTEFSCRVFEKQFPELKQLLAVEGVSIELPATIQDLLDRAAVFCNQEQILDQKVSIKISNRRLKLYVEGETGWFEEETNMPYKGNDLAFTINPHLLKTIVAQSRSCTVNDRCFKFIGDSWQHVVALMAQ